MPRLRQQLGRTIRALRERTRLSQEKFAHRIGMDPSFVGEVERAETNCSVDTLELIAGGLGMPVWEILRAAEAAPGLTKEPTLRPAAGSSGTVSFLIVVQQAADGYSAYAPDLLGCAASAPTPELVEDHMRAAIAVHLAERRVTGAPPPPSRSYATMLEVFP